MPITVPQRRPSIIQRSRSRPSWFVVLALIVLGAWHLANRRDDVDALPREGQVVLVTEAIDGCSLLLDSGQRVRLIGVRPPETSRPDSLLAPRDAAARAHLHALASGQQVTLKFDRERRDESGRVLAYVYLNDRLLNEETIADGFGFADARSPYRADRKRVFRDAEARARAAEVGQWAPVNQSPALQD